jgi:GNAT superfamily N-acetyltransferase
MPLTSDHDISQFDCGKPPLNDFLKRYALASQTGGSARTFVTTEHGSRVIGYYSLAAAALRHQDAPERVRKGQPQHPVPAILMARFAVHLSAQGKGLGGRLRSLNVTETLGVRAFVVDVKDDEARRFYQRFDMMFVPGKPDKLFLLFKDIKKLLTG